MERIDPFDASSESASFSSSSEQVISTDLRSVEKSDVHQRDVLNTPEVMHPASCTMQMEHVPALQDSSKQKRSARFNFRKSLAWDSSFFTGEGFLDAEELATMNSAYKKAEERGFPIIQENTKNSFESNSTFNRDRWTIESNEPDIFESVRASIQKSFNASDGARPVKLSCTKNVARRFSDHAPRKVRSSSAKMVKPPIASKKTDPICKERIQNSKDIDHANMVGVGNGCNKQSIKTSQPSSGIIETQNKRISNDLLWKTNGIVVSGNCRSGVSKNIVIHQESCVMPPQSSSSKISPGSPALPRMILTASCSSSTGSRRTLDQKSKTSQVIARKKFDIWNKGMNSIQSSTAKSPVMISKSKKGNRRANNHQAHLNSVSKVSNVSPNCSIKSTLSLSSSSSMPTKSTNSFDAWSSSDSNFSHKSGFETVNLSRPYGSMDQEGNSVKSSSPSSKTSFEASLSEMSSTVDDSRTHDNNSEMKGCKPSGLRMPRPKIGYFDAVSSKGTSKCTVEAGNAAGIITPKTNNNSLLESTDSLPQIANPQPPRSTIKMDAPASLRPLSPSPQSSGVNHIVECYENLGSSGRRTFINDNKGIVTPPGIGGEDLIIAQHLRSLDVNGGMDETNLCSKPVEAGDIIPNAAGYIWEGISDADDQFKQTCHVLVEKLSDVKFSALSHNKENKVDSSSRCSVKTHERVNLLESADPKATQLEQLVKRHSSVKPSLPDANVLETSEKLKSLLSCRDSEWLEFQNSSPSPACTPATFDVLPRKPLVESNCNRQGPFGARMGSANTMAALVRPQGKASH